VLSGDGRPANAPNLLIYGRSKFQSQKPKVRNAFAFSIGYTHR
jgi:hypothetical protein